MEGGIGNEGQYSDVFSFFGCAFCLARGDLFVKKCVLDNCHYHYQIADILHGSVLFC